MRLLLLRLLLLALAAAPLGGSSSSSSSSFNDDSGASHVGHCSWSQQQQAGTEASPPPGSCTPQQRHLNSHAADGGDDAIDEADAGFDGRRHYIVRFKEYESAERLRSELTGVLGAEGADSWSWVPRDNAAYAKHPTDFGLIAVQPSQLDELRQRLLAAPSVRGVHADKRMRGTLDWKPEGPLAALFVDAESEAATAAAAAGAAAQPHVGAAAAAATASRHSRRMHAADGAGGAHSIEEAAEEAELQQQRQEVEEREARGANELDEYELADFAVSKRPGRFSTPMYADHYDDSDAADRELLLVSGSSDGGGGGGGSNASLLSSSSSSSAWAFPADGEMEEEEERHGRGARDGGAGGGQQRRRLQQSRRTTVPQRLEADVLWKRGFTGKGVRVGVFDTGIQERHPHIRNIRERTNWTHQKSLSDGLGHGTFVAGVIGGQDAACPGFAPDVDLYTFKVFTDDQVSFTSWFMDAFNYAIALKVHVINLSIGGPDFLDAPFVDKVQEVTSNGIIMISAIGNDGPLYGTLNNPADQNDVIGVGAVTDADQLASFSSRGMTTWEMPRGSGRVKPDVVGYGRDVMGSKIGSGCRSLSGTSVASPVVAGAVCLLASCLPEPRRWAVLNPASMKQALVEGAAILPGIHMYEQGNGKINLLRSLSILESYTPRASVIPAVLDLTSCPYAWPYCKQPLYAHAMPLVFNATVLNGMGVTGKFAGRPRYTPSDAAGQLIDVQFEYSDVLWPWSGYLALYIRVKPSATQTSATANGAVTFTITSPPGPGETSPRSSDVTLPLRVPIIPTPPREKRLLWDQFHSIRYPPGYIPRDNLEVKNDILDWHGDHLYTNYQSMYNFLRSKGYHVEVLGSPLTCFEADRYGALLLADSEEEYYPEEVAKVAEDVAKHGLGLLVFGEWYNVEAMRTMRFFDDNTRSWWTPVTGGANVPALNDLLQPYGIAFGDVIVSGTATVGNHRVQANNGANIARFPKGGYLHVAQMSNSGVKGKAAGGGAAATHAYGAFGVLPHGAGHVAVFGDSNCLDSSHMRANCFDFLVSLLERVTRGPAAQPALTPDSALLKEDYVFGAAGGATPPPLPQRRPDVNLTVFSRVLSNPLACHPNAPCHFLPPPGCHMAHASGEGGGVGGLGRSDASGGQQHHQHSSSLRGAFNAVGVRSEAGGAESVPGSAAKGAAQQQAGASSALGLAASAHKAVQQAWQAWQQRSNPSVPSSAAARAAKPAAFAAKPAYGPVAAVRTRGERLLFSIAVVLGVCLVGAVVVAIVWGYTDPGLDTRVIAELLALKRQQRARAAAAGRERPQERETP